MTAASGCNAARPLLRRVSDLNADSECLPVLRAEVGTGHISASSGCGQRALAVAVRRCWAAGLRWAMAVQGAVVAISASGAGACRLVNRRVEGAIRQASSTRSTAAIG